MCRRRLEVWPTRKWFVLGGGLEYSEWDQGSGDGSHRPSRRSTRPQTLPGLGASPTYLHVQGSAAVDWRTGPGYTRRGGVYGITVHDFVDHDTDFSFRQVDYDAIQHIPVLRDAWVLSLHGRLETTSSATSEQVPFFMLPALGGGSTLRGFASWRFRDRNSLLLQAEWRVLGESVPRHGAVLRRRQGDGAAARTSVRDGMKSDYGLGFRFHGPAATPLRIELARSNEGLVDRLLVEGAFLGRAAIQVNLRGVLADLKVRPTIARGSALQF